jgi:hypothetical protein
MPSFGDFNLPPPKSDDKLEDLIWDLYRKIWNDPDAQRVGRSGQRQNGVDFVGRPDGGPSLAGVQVKLRTQRLTIAEWRSAVKEREQFTPQLDSFAVVTSAPSDAKLQQVARELTRENLAPGRFTVSVLGWQEIERRLFDYPALMRNYYGSLFRADAAEAAPALHLELSDEGDRVVDQRPDQVVSLVLHNDSPVVATQFQLQIRLPFLPPTLSQPIGPRRVPRPVTGTERDGDAWRHWKEWRDSDGSIGVTFVSHGAISVLPHFPLVLGQFLVPTGWFRPEPRPHVYQCKYDLGAGIGEARHGALSLSLFELREGFY